ncbi:hypothetical protein VP01_201g3 [Puccinia sorghi]|uniref:Uncharacterized protein n=1 Tax=Puccinia sorghi TaxID=27349 RepID=A0A0L6VBA2_9BASI|nr:hypothetical protein VP01_201g3 [Puccinia sorghi]
MFDTHYRGCGSASRGVVKVTGSRFAHPAEVSSLMCFWGCPTCRDVFWWMEWRRDDNEQDNNSGGVAHLLRRPSFPYLDRGDGQREHLGDRGRPAPCTTRCHAPPLESNCGELWAWDQNVFHFQGSRCRHPALEFAQIGVSDGLILRRPHIAKLPWAMCMFRVSWKLFPAPRRDVHRPNIPSTHPKLNAHLPSFIYLPILPRPPSKQHFRHSFPFLCHQILSLMCVSGGPLLPDEMLNNSKRVRCQTLPENLNLLILSWLTSNQVGVFLKKQLISWKLIQALYVKSFQLNNTNLIHFARKTWTTGRSRHTKWQTAHSVKLAHIEGDEPRQVRYLNFWSDMINPISFTGVQHATPPPLCGFCDPLDIALLVWVGCRTNLCYGSNFSKCRLVFINFLGDLMVKFTAKKIAQLPVVDIQKVPGSFCFTLPKHVHIQAGEVWMAAWLEHAACQLQAVEQVFFAGVNFSKNIFEYFAKIHFGHFKYYSHTFNSSIYFRFNLIKSCEKELWKKSIMFKLKQIKTLCFKLFKPGVVPKILKYVLFLKNKLDLKILHPKKCRNENYYLQICWNLTPKINIELIICILRNLTCDHCTKLRCVNPLKHIISQKSKIRMSTIKLWEFLPTITPPLGRAILSSVLGTFGSNYPEAFGIFETEQISQPNPPLCLHDSTQDPTFETFTSATIKKFKNPSRKAFSLNRKACTSKKNKCRCSHIFSGEGKKNNSILTLDLCSGLLFNQSYLSHVEHQAQHQTQCCLKSTCYATKHLHHLHRRATLNQ